MDAVAESLRLFVEEITGISIMDMAIQIISTLLLFLVVRFFFWNNITNYLEERKSIMAKEYEEAEEKSAEATLNKEQAENELREIRLSAKGILDESKLRGENERLEIVSKAKKEAQQVLDNTKKEVESEIEKARAAMNNEIVTVAVEMAEKIIKKEIDKSKHEDLINEVTSGVVN